MFLPVIPEITTISISEEEIRDNLSLETYELDLYDVYKHRTTYDTEEARQSEEIPDRSVLILNVERDEDNRVVVTHEYVVSYKQRETKDVYEHRLLLLDQFKLPNEFKNCTVKSFDVNTESCVKARSKIKYYVLDFPNRSLNGEGVFIAGPTGTGKTHLAVALGKAIIQQWLTPCKYINVGTWAHDLVYGVKSFDDKKQNIESMKHARVLILDDLGAELELASKSQPIGTIRLVLMDRYDKTLPTIITTNLGNEKLDEYLGARVMSRLRGKNISISLMGTDYRASKTADWSDVGREVRRN